MPNFKSTDVDSRLVSDAAASIDDYLRELESMFKMVESGIVPNLTPYWQGLAKENFEQKIAFFALQLSDIIAGYKDLNEQLKKSGMAYDKTDDSVKQIIAKLPK